MKHEFYQERQKNQKHGEKEFQLLEENHKVRENKKHGRQPVIQGRSGFKGGII